jgi:hypothetical protein
MFIPKTTPDAEFSAIRTKIRWCSGNVEEVRSFHHEGDIAAYRAVVADVIHRIHLPGAGTPERHFLDKGTRRTNIDTVAAGNTVCLMERLFHRRLHNGAESAVHKSQCGNIQNLSTGVHASSAAYALVQIDFHKWMTRVDFVSIESSFESFLVNSIFCAIVLECAGESHIASAFCATQGFDSCCLIAVSMFDFIETEYALEDRNLIGLISFGRLKRWNVLRGELVEIISLTFEAGSQWLNDARLDVLVNGQGGFASGSNGINGVGWTCNNVSAGEDTRP